MRCQDLYTKIVLTIIAVSLVLLVLQNFFQVDSVSAEGKYRGNEVIDVNIAEVGGGYVSYGTLDVNLENSELDVNVTNSELDVNVGNEVYVEVTNEPLWVYTAESANNIKKK